MSAPDLPQPDGYDPAKDAHDSYFAAIEAKRQRGDTHDWSRPLLAPFPYFGGKRKIVEAVWSRLGTPKQYIEPFCGSAAMLLAAPRRAELIWFSPACIDPGSTAQSDLFSGAAE